MTKNTALDTLYPGARLPFMIGLTAQVSAQAEDEWRHVARGLLDDPSCWVFIEGESLIPLVERVRLILPTSRFLLPGEVADIETLISDTKSLFPERNDLIHGTRLDLGDGDLLVTRSRRGKEPKEPAREAVDFARIGALVKAIRDLSARLFSVQTTLRLRAAKEHGLLREGDAHELLEWPFVDGKWIWLEQIDGVLAVHWTDVPENFAHWAHTPQSALDRPQDEGTNDS